MKCPQCLKKGTKVIDSRHIDENFAIRRRRTCLSCNHRFTTYENVEKTPLLIIKKDGSRQSFSKEKMMRGIIRACEGRQISIEDMEKLADKIEKNLKNLLLKEIESTKIGNEIMSELKNIDEVSYVRFASVYKNFKDIDSFMQELQQLKNEKKEL